MKNSSNHSKACEEHLHTKISLVVVYSLFSVSGTLVNLLVIYLVFSFKKLRTTSNAFIVNVCVADLLVCAFWMPQAAILIAKHAFLPYVYRVFMEGLLFLGVMVSLLSHSLVAINRYILITKIPSTYYIVYQKRNTEWMIAMSWMIAVISLLPWLLGQVSSETNRECTPVRLRTDFLGGDFVIYSSYTSAMFAMAICVQTPILLFSYFKIFRKVQVSIKRVSVLNFQIVSSLSYPLPRKDKRLRFHVLFVLCVFIWTAEPFMLVVLYGLFNPIPKLLQSVTWGNFCLLFILNPPLYTWKNEEFRKSLKAVIRGELWRASTVGVEPTIKTISLNDPQQS
ncbi:probable G-protein coupled receptor 88 [Latimeria chalumnae]|uniref:probable G-protein coupled receptor 88 n=1 Tax=Latimeria chalumnae TaxID=7897 RepID=UPI0003C1179A|nr:PREDICTED: probable G-protein coupled receptor 88 [Latimeria chalumnae]|eukprot:XP_006000086.1 PREDICTED: probable G-protein coupled receptor 88 [Latimeria chalumnae]